MSEMQRWIASVGKGPAPCALFSVIITGRNTIEAEDHYLLANPAMTICAVRLKLEN